MTEVVEVIVAAQEIIEVIAQVAPEVVEVNTGTRGLPGDEGRSAYEVALDAGFEGTEAEWLASLRGEPRTWSDLSGRPDAFAPAPHQHEIADVAGLADALAGLAPADDYATTADLDALAGATAAALDAKAAAIHTHDIADVTGLADALASKQPSGDYATAAQGALADTAVQPGDLAAVATTGAYADLSGLPALGTAAAAAVEDFAATERGLPAGGTTGQVLTKSSAADYATAWADPSGGGDVTQAEFDALTAYAQTAARFASPNAGGIVSGKYYSNSFSALAEGTLAGATDQVDMSPFFFGRDFLAREVGLAVSGAVADAQVKAFIYASGSDGWPDALIYETLAMDASTTGAKYEDMTGIGGLTLEAGRAYWVGARYLLNPTIRAVPLGSTVNLGLTNATTNQVLSVIRRNIPFTTPLPANWGFSDGDLRGNTPPPSIRWRAW